MQQIRKARRVRSDAGENGSAVEAVSKEGAAETNIAAGAPIQR